MVVVGYVCLRISLRTFYVTSLEDTLTVGLPEASSVVKESAGLIVQLVALPRDWGGMVQNISVILTVSPVLSEMDICTMGGQHR